MTLANMDSPKEQQGINEYLDYIGVSKDPIFASLNNNSPPKWGTGSPPGGPGQCATLYQGSVYNASCDQKLNYICEEKTPAPK